MAKNDSTSDWLVRSSSEWVLRRRFVKPDFSSFRTMADPTNPLWPATKIFAVFSDINEPGFKITRKSTTDYTIKSLFDLKCIET